MGWLERRAARVRRVVFGNRRTWMEFSVKSGLAMIAAQSEELSGIRNRTINFTAFIVAACGLLVGVGLNQTDRTIWFYAIAILGTLLFAALAFLVVRIVVPSRGFSLTLNPEALMSWMDEENRTFRDSMSYLATDKLPKMIEHNEVQLQAVRREYRTLLIVAFATLAVWVALVWVFA